MAKEPEPTTLDGFGIVNPYGDMWTVDIFATEALARAHLDDFWGHAPAVNLDRFRIVRARQITIYFGETEKEA